MISWQRLSAVAVVAAVAMAACSEAAPEPVETIDPFAAVVAARATFAEPVVTLSTEVQELQIAARRVRVEGLDGGVLQTAIEDLQQRITDVHAAAGDVVADTTAGLGEGATPDPAVVDANAAWAAAAASAIAAAEAAAVEVATVSRLVDFEDRLDAVVDVWNRPGSRREQLDRLAEAAGEAEGVANEAAALDVSSVDPPCLNAAGLRATAAETIASRTLELRDLVDRFAGTEFDERRAEYSEDPDDLGPLPDLDATDAACWDGSAAVVAHVDDVLAAIQALQQALNPPPR